jgi:Na+-transporting NADH:ubiquinone oxidoreductase subunit NqrF
MLLTVKIRLLHGNKTRIIECEPGNSLYALLSHEGLMDAPCGGTGLCGKCKVRIESQEVIPANESQTFFTPEQIAAGWRLACNYQVASDISVELPQQLEMSNSLS